MNKITPQQPSDSSIDHADTESVATTDYRSSAARAQCAADQSLCDLSASHAAYQTVVENIMRREAPLEQVLQWDREKKPPLAVLTAMVNEGVFVSGVPIPSYELAAPQADALLQAGLITRETKELLARPTTQSDLQKQQFLSDVGRDGHARAMGIAAQSIAKLAGVGIGTFMGVSTGLSAQTIFRVGTLAQQAFWLNALNQGVFTYGFALTEKDVGSDPRSLTTTFSRETDAVGQTVFRLNGNKKFIGNAARVVDAEGNVVHRGADYLLVFAVDDSRKPPKDRVFHCFMVPRARIGEQNIRHSGGEHNKTGLREVNNGNFDLADVVVPECCVLGIPGENMYPKLMGTLDVTRFLVGAMGIGTAEAALEIASRYASQRRQNGRLIAQYPMVSFPLQELAARVLVGRLLVMEAATLVDQADREQREVDRTLDAGLALVETINDALRRVFESHKNQDAEHACRSATQACAQALRTSERLKLKDRRAMLASAVADLQRITLRLRDSVKSELVEPVKVAFRTSRDLLALVARAKEPIRFGTETAMAKLYGSELAQRTIYQAIQTLGGNGFMESPEEGQGLGKRSRDAAVLSIYEGQSGIQRNVIAQGILLQQLKKVSLPILAPGSLRQKLRHLLLKSKVTKDAHYQILMSTSRTPVERANAAFKYAVVDVMARYDDTLKAIKRAWKTDGVPEMYCDWDEASIERQQNLLASNPVQGRLALLADIAVERKLIHLASRELEALGKSSQKNSLEQIIRRQLLEDFQIMALERVLELTRRMFGESLALQEKRHAEVSKE
jgi:alkylation response protein AidB-like acyl-CoA dehydrogenase